MGHKHKQDVLLSKKQINSICDLYNELSKILKIIITTATNTAYANMSLCVCNAFTQKIKEILVNCRLEIFVIMEN